MSPQNPRVVSLVEEYGGRIKDPAKVILRLAKGLIRQERGSLTARTKVPIRPEELAPKLGARIEESQTLGADAGLRKEGDEWVVLVSDRLEKGRRNFAAFHEMSHVFFARAVEKRRPFLSRAEAQRIRDHYIEEEKLCNLAAGELLFPKEVFADRMTAESPSWRLIYGLASAFEGSVDAALRRFLDLYEGHLVMESWIRQDERYLRRITFRTASMEWLFGKKGQREEQPHPAVVEAFRSGKGGSGQVRLFVQGSFQPFKVTTRCVRRKQGDGQEVQTILAPLPPEESQRELALS